MLLFLLDKYKLQKMQNCPINTWRVLDSCDIYTAKQSMDLYFPVTASESEFQKLFNNY